MSCALEAATAAVEGDGRLAGISSVAPLPSACLPLPIARPVTVSLGAAS
jgi:hypothetical protein